MQGTHNHTPLRHSPPSFVTPPATNDPISDGAVIARCRNETQLSSVPSPLYNNEIDQSKEHPSPKNISGSKNGGQDKKDDLGDDCSSSPYSIAPSESASAITMPSKLDNSHHDEDNNVEAEEELVVMQNDPNPTSQLQNHHYPYGWIIPNQKYTVEYRGTLHSKRWMPYEAKALVRPYLNAKNHWVVDVQWDWGKRRQGGVDCTWFVDPSRRASRRRSTTTINRANNESNKRQQRSRGIDNLAQDHQGLIPRDSYSLPPQQEQGRSRRQSANGISAQKRGAPTTWGHPADVHKLACLRPMQNLARVGDESTTTTGQTKKLDRHQRSNNGLRSPPTGTEYAQDMSVLENDDDAENFVKFNQEPRKEREKPKNHDNGEDQELRRFQKAVEELIRVTSSHRAEAEIALREVGSPFPLQEAMCKLQLRRERLKATPSLQTIEIGMKIFKSFENGEVWQGEVIREVEELGIDPKDGRLFRMWRVRYEDQDEEDMEWEEILRWQLSVPPTHPPSPRGRHLQCLELFCGSAVVSQEFIRRGGWKVASVDNAEGSHVTIKKDVLLLEPEKDLPFVPDFIWASPPCDTFSLLAGGKHRTKTPGSLNKREAMKYHELLFTKMAQIILWAMKKHPHLVVVIENPVGLLAHMPLMKKLEGAVTGLEREEVHYCAFGWDEKKPTHLWTNELMLRSILSGFRCSKRCCVEGNHRETPSLLSDGFEVAVIPQLLAEEVSKLVDAIFLLHKPCVRFTAAIEPAAIEPDAIEL